MSEVFVYDDAIVFYRTLHDAEIRRRQRLCDQQTERAATQGNRLALANLQLMSDALMAVMMERTP